MWADVVPASGLRWLGIGFGVEADVVPGLGVELGVGPGVDLGAGDGAGLGNADGIASVCEGGKVRL